MAFDLTGKAVKNIRLHTVTYGKSTAQVILAKYGDVNSRYLRVSMFDDRGNVEIDGYTQIRLNATLPNGERKYTIGEADLNDGVAVCELSGDMLSELGSVACDVTFTRYDANGAGSSLTSETFYVYVSEKQNDGDADLGEDELEAIDVILTRLSATEGAMADAETQRNASETQRALNENQRIATEEERKTAEAQRVDAESLRTSAENARSTAEDNRVLAENARIANNSAKNRSVKLSRMRIETLEQGITPEPFVTDDTAARAKIIPADILPYAEIKKIGGMTYRDEATNTLKDAKVTSIESRGINIWDGSWELGGLVASTGKPNGDTSVTRCVNYLPVMENTAYYIYKKNPEDKVRIYYYDESKGFISASYIDANKNDFTTPSGAHFIRFQTISWVITDTDDGDICIGISSPATDGKYFPYRGVIDTFAVPEAVQALDGYGLGINADCYNHVDWEKKQFVRNVGKYTLTGTEPVTKHSAQTLNGLNVFYISPSPFDYYLEPSVVMLADKYQYNGTIDSGNRFKEKEYPNGTMYAYRNYALTSRSLYFVSDAADVATFKQSITGMNVLYKMAEPIETDISDLLLDDNFIDVDSGSTIVAIGSDQLDATFSVTYYKGISFSSQISESQEDIEILGKRVANIEGIIDAPFVADDGVAHTKYVPINAMPYAAVSKVGGMTYKSKNLIPFPYRESNKTENGLTFTVKEDGGIYVKGTATATTYFVLSGGIAFADQSVYSNDGINTYGGKTYQYCTFYKEGDNARVHFSVSSGTTVDKTVYPMIHEGSTALPYERYYEGLKYAKVTSIESRGANLIPFPYVDGSSKTINGVTFTVQADGGVHAKGTTTDTAANFYLCRGIAFADKSVWSVSSKTPYGGKTFQDVNYYKSSTSDSVYIEIKTNRTVDTVYYPMIHEGETALPYMPYRGVIDALAIPEAVQALEWYGLGTKRTYQGKDYVYANRVDFENKKYIAEVERVVFDGTEAWSSQYTGENTFYKVKLNKNVIGNSNGTCSHFDFAQVGSTSTDIGWFVENTVYPANFRIRPNLTDFPSVAEWKAHLAELYASGTPLTFVYALEEPTTTDISDLLPDDNFIEVEGGGTIVSVNEHDFGAPTEIEYMLKEVTA